MCRLHPVRGPDRRRLECEPVADAPDIELRLFTPPGSDPVLAEVAFPARMTPAAAREYLARELERSPASRGPDRPGRRRRTARRSGSARRARAGVRRHWPGLREELVGLETRAVHFAADWARRRAKAWAAEHVGRRDCGRVATLSHPYRACPGLARWLNTAFAPGFAVPPPGTPAARRVPGRPGRRPAAARPRPAPAGSAGPGTRSTWPTRGSAPPFRRSCATCPPTGHVNIPEAQALVRHLEPLAGRASRSRPRSRPSSWSCRPAGPDPAAGPVRVVEPADAPERMRPARGQPDPEPRRPGGDVRRDPGRPGRAVGPGAQEGVVRRRPGDAGPAAPVGRAGRSPAAAEAARERAWVAALADCPRVAGVRRRPGSTENART